MSTVVNAIKLIYTLQGQEREVVLTQPRVTLGRAPECTVVFPPDTTGVSRYHATIFREGGEWFIADDDSRNGTYVDNARITKARLYDGAQINLGNLELAFQLTALQPASEDQPLPSTASMTSAGSQKPVLREFVEFDDAPVPDVSMSINLAQLQERKRSGSSLRVRTGAREQTTDEVDVTDAPEESPSGGLLDELHPMIEDRSWGIDLFSEVGRALLSSTDLDVMLNNILNLVFTNVPAERGLICLHDEETGELTPKCVSAAGDEPQQSVRISRSIARKAIQDKTSLLIMDVAEDSRFADAASVKRLNINSAMCVPLYHEGRIGGVIYVDTRNRSQPFRQEHLEVLTALALFSAVAVEQARLRDNVLHEQRIRERLARYSSPGVVEQIVSSSDSLSEQMMADEKEVSVLFGDLSGFTALSENMEAGDVVQLLNGIFDHLTDAVFQYGGTLDKFMGDGLLAFFGAPLPQPHHAEVAVRAAVEMQSRLKQYNEMLGSERQIEMRIGINSGPVIVGDIGSPNRKDYTVIGDVVNVASRLESSVARPGQIIIGPTTYEMIKSKFRCQPLGPQELKGKKRIVDAYLLLPDQPPKSESTP